MPVFIDICRICLQEVDNQEVQEINIPKLKNLITSRPFVNFRFLQKWQIELFVNHLICSTCIHNFRTVLTTYRDSNKSSFVIFSERNKHKISKVNLKTLSRFSHVEGDFRVCRLCLEPTMKIAIYLYDNSKNILPVEYIGKMLKYIKIFMNVKGTINPILCQKCWENIQVAYSFCKRLEIVTEKMFYYQALFDKIYIDQEDLHDVLSMWDTLGIIDIKTEVDIVIKQEINEELKPSDLKPAVKKIGRPPKKQKKNSNIEEEYSFYDDHNYFKLDKNVRNNISGSKIKKDVKPIKRKGETTKRRIKENYWEMPVLKPNIEGVEEECKKIPKMKPNNKTDIDNTKGSNRLLRSKMKTQTEKQNKEKMDLNVNSELPQQAVKPKLTKSNKKLKVMTEENKIQEEKPKDANKEQFLRINLEKKVSLNIQGDLKNTSHKAKLRKIKKGKIIKTLQKKQKAKFAKNSELLKLLTTETTRPITRLSAKKEISSDLYSQDLLVLKKEEIIKNKRHKKTLNASFPKHNSTPNISEGKENVSAPAIENLLSKSISNSEYTFETLNLDEDIHVKKEIIEEEELQIKRENVSECDPDDNFIENTDCTTYNTEDSDEECPNLESFIKSEPLDESYTTNLDEEEPPELEFQGLCQSVPIPMPCFTIQDTFTVDEKRNIISTVDDKRTLNNKLEEKRFSLKPLVNAESSINPIADKSDPPSSLLDTFTVDKKRNIINTVDDKGIIYNKLKEKGFLIKPLVNAGSSISPIADKSAPPSSLLDTFTVDKKCNIINTVDDKGILYNKLTEKGFSIKPVVNAGSSINPIADKSAPPSSLLDTFTVDKKRNIINTVDDKGILYNKLKEKRFSIKPLVNAGSSINPIADKSAPPSSLLDTFTFDEKRTTVDETNKLINMLEEKESSTKPLVDVGSSKHTIAEKSASPPPLIIWDSFQTSQSKLKGNESTMQEASFLKAKGDLLKQINVPISSEEDRCSQVNETLVINANKLDAKATLTFEDKKTQDMFAKDNEKAKSSELPDSESSFKVCSPVEKLHEDLKISFSCSLCNFSTDSLQATEAHLTKHSDSFFYKCKNCPYVSMSKWGLKTHINNVHMTLGKPYFCKMCDFSSTSRSAIKAHLTKHSASSFYECENCPYVSLSRWGLKTHVTNVHMTSGTPYFCQKCDFISTSSRAIKGHLNRHASNSLHLHRCKICPFASTLKMGLAEHMVIKHSHGLDSYTATLLNLENPKNRRTSKIGWSEEDTALLMEHFELYINERTYPPKENIHKFIENTKIERTLAAVRTKINKLWPPADLSQEDSSSR